MLNCTDPSITSLDQFPKPEQTLPRQMEEPVDVLYYEIGQFASTQQCLATGIHHTG